MYMMDTTKFCCKTSHANFSPEISVHLFFNCVCLQYGQIHVVFKEMVLEKYGEDVWNKVLDKAKMDGEKDFLQFKNYPDPCFVGLIAAIIHCVGETKDTVLEEFGYFFIKYCLSFGYDNMLRTLGGDIVSFVQNLDSLHSLLSLTYKGINPPSFRCEETESGELLLHYYSCRAGLSPLAVGLIRAAGKEIFNHTVELKRLTTVREDLGEDKFQEHTVFNVRFPDLVVRPQVSVAQTPSPVREVDSASQSDKLHPQSPRILSPIDQAITLNGQQFCKTFPYHVFFDTTLTILQCGDALRRLLPAGVGPGSRMMEAFRIQYPRMAWSVENIQSFTNTIFMLAVLPRNGHTHRTLNIKGQMIWFEEEQRMMFIGSPRLKSLKEMKEMDVYMADIPLFDVTREIVLLYEQRNAEIGITQKLDMMTAELKRTSLALEVERHKTEQLLHQMLPPKVAIQLKNGENVEAETFKTATVMFSDVVTFTSIAAACPPEKIVNMLNDMYERFDRATTERGVYKAQQVPSPATGKPLQIRVGIHTGPVMAGVVGIKMPRYCLFGDTVNTASRMESHGVPGRIHISPATFRLVLIESSACTRPRNELLVEHEFRIKRRGSILVKGKGLMTTFFLVGDTSMVAPEPEDEFTALPLVPRLAANTTSSFVDRDTTYSYHDGETYFSDTDAETDSSERLPGKDGATQNENGGGRTFGKRQLVSPRLIKPDYGFLVSNGQNGSSARRTEARSSFCALL
ncbi:hypothetical protein BaRGS_00020190 [Batillaria attramentaria]|uniref:guanylate cyclase n=1 Tax=Batillaria attramentaria TaxID=370345 RepID=A0ABD0KMT5_9CAEN